jgi:anthranilate phosphoribosyltransferase
MAGALARLGVDRALLVSGEDGLDEISATAPTRVVEVNGEEIERYTLTPARAGVDPGAAATVVGGAPEENAAVTRGILGGEDAPGTELAVVNAGGAIYAAGAAASIADGVQAAREAIASGRAADALERYVEVTRRLAPAEAAR